MNTTKPVHQARLGTVKAAVWANPTDGGRARYSVTVQRSYRDGDEWKHSTSIMRVSSPGQPTSSGEPCGCTIQRSTRPKGWPFCPAIGRRT